MPTQRQIKAAKKVSENLRKKKPKSIGKVLREVGYSESVSNAPQQVTGSKGFQQLMEEMLPDDQVLEAHQQLLRSTRVEHMVFPLCVSDDEIKELIKSVNCEVRKIKHGETAIHCWYWSPDNKARKDAIDLAYKIKGRITNKVKIEDERENPYKNLTEGELRKLAGDK